MLDNINWNYDMLDDTNWNYDMLDDTNFKSWYARWQ